PRPSRRPRAARRPRPARRGARAGRYTGSVARGARERLRGFRQASVVAVAMTGVLLLVLSPRDPGAAQSLDAAVAVDSAETLPDSVAVIRWIPVEELRAQPAEVTPDSAARRAAAEATGTLRGLWEGFLGNLPKYLIALAI